MNSVIFVSTLLAFIGTYFAIGIYASKKVHSTVDYFLAGKTAGFWGITFTLIGTQLGSGLLLGTAEKSYEYGFFGIAYTLSIAIGFLLLSLGFAAKLHELNVRTTAEVFLVRYNSPFLHKCASLLSIVTLCGILMGQIVASKGLLAGVLAGTNIPVWALYVILWGSIIVYTFVGGLHAVIRADTFRVLFIMVIFGGFFLFLLWTQPMAWFTTNALGTQKALFPIAQEAIKSLVAILLMQALFSLIEQDLAQRFFAARTARIATAAAVAAGTFIMLFAIIPVFLGMLAKVSALSLFGANPLVATLRAYSGDVFFALGICGIFAAVASTSDSLLCAISSNIAQDFDFSFIKSLSNLKRAKIITALVGLSTVLVAYVIHKDIIDILIDSYEISVSALLVPLVFAYFQKQPKLLAAYVSAIAGFASFLVFKWYPVNYSDIIVLGLSLVGYYVGQLLSKK